MSFEINFPFIERQEGFFLSQFFEKFGTGCGDYVGNAADIPFTQQVFYMLTAGAAASVANAVEH